MPTGFSRYSHRRPLGAWGPEGSAAGDSAARSSTTETRVITRRDMADRVTRIPPPVIGGTGLLCEKSRTLSIGREALWTASGDRPSRVKWDQDRGLRFGPV